MIKICKTVVLITLLFVVVIITPAFAATLSKVDTAEYTFLYPSNFKKDPKSLTYTSPTAGAYNVIGLEIKNPSIGVSCTLTEKNPAVKILEQNSFTTNGYRGCYLKVESSIGQGKTLVLEGRRIIKNNVDYVSSIQYEKSTSATEIKDMVAAMNAFIVKAVPTTTTTTSPTKTLTQTPLATATSTQSEEEIATYFPLWISLAIGAVIIAGITGLIMYKRRQKQTYPPDSQ